MFGWHSNGYRCRDNSCNKQQNKRVIPNKIMKNATMKTTNHLVIPALVAAALLAVAASSANAVTDLGNPFRPTGANFQIYGEQNVNLSTGQSQGGTPQVNLNFEDTAGYGVQYTNAMNNQTEFGIGLYDTTPPTTGLRLQYDNNVLASSLTATLSDFDLMSTATVFDYAHKVAPGILLLGVGGNVIANALPQNILNSTNSALTFLSNTGGTDFWNLNFSQLLTNLGLSQNTLISGYVLYADDTHSEMVPSDPYFLSFASNGVTTVPDGGSTVMLLGSALLGLAGLRRKLQKG